MVGGTSHDRGHFVIEVVSKWVLAFFRCIQSQALILVDDAGDRLNVARSSTSEELLKSAFSAGADQLLHGELTLRNLDTALFFDFCGELNDTLAD